MKNVVFNQGFNISLVVNQLSKNIAFLEAICDFTYDQHFMTPKMHQKLRHDRHEAHHIMKIYRKIHAISYQVIDYTLKERNCNHSGASPMHKMVARVYMNLHVLFELAH